MKNANIIAMIIGVIGITNGIVQIYKGQDFQDYFFSLVIGMTLTGSAYFNYRQWDKQNDKD